MKKIISFLAILQLCSCAINEPGSVVFLHPQPDRKFKQKAVFLQKKLAKAEQTLVQDQQTIEEMRQKLSGAQLDAIESQVERLENRWRQDPSCSSLLMRHEISRLFLDEREALSRMIQSGSNALRAQVLLDRILQLITQMSDSVAISP